MALRQGRADSGAMAMRGSQSHIMFLQLDGFVICKRRIIIAKYRYVYIILYWVDICSRAYHVICQPWVDKCTTSVDYPVQYCTIYICRMPAKWHDNISEYDTSLYY